MSARCMATPLNANAAAGHTMWTRASETIGHQGMYNGNISWMETNLSKFGKQAMLYKYDQLNRITKSRSLAFGNNAYAARSGDQKYDEDYSYDANGNILTLKRHDDKAAVMDDFNYSYYANTNRLLKHKTAGGTYEYDAIGNLIKDNNENLSIAWTPSGKVRSVVKPDTTIYFRYDAMGNRIAKIVSTDSKSDTTAYVRDASGNVMTIYNNRTAVEAPIYGSGRIGEYMGKEKEGYQTFNLRKYELTNHLGNVLAVISDKVNLYGHDNRLDSARATVMSASDYYPFGLPMKGRQFNEKNFRYGFNGKEKDNSFSSSSSYDYGFRIYAPSIGRWLSTDPLAMKYPFASSYNFVLNTPIQAYDPDGKRVYFIGGAGNDTNGWNYKQRFKQIWEDKGIQDVRTMTATHGKVVDILFTNDYRLFSEVKGTTGTTSKITSKMIEATVNAIVKDLATNPLEEGEQLNLAGYSYGSVLQAHVAIALADKGLKVDNLSLVGSPISDKSDLMGTLQKYKKEGKIGNIQRVDIDGDNLSNPSDALQYLKGAYESLPIGEGDNAHHFDLARPGKEADKKIGEAADKLKSEGVK